MHFTTKSKNTMAQIFEQYVHSDNLYLIKDERQRQQIISVNNELKAPETPMGHGDAFFSIAMALQAVHETMSQSTYETLGNFAEWQDAVDPNLDQERNINISISDTLKKKKDNPALQEQGDKKGVETPSGINLSWSDQPEEDPEVPNPQCEEVVCTQEFWVTERKLCLYCGYRGKL